MRIPLTDKEEQVWGYILGFDSDNGFSPKLTEIMERFTYTKPLAQYYVRQLEKKGWITKVETSRNIRINTQEYEKQKLA